jgi:hypothetical protein
MALAERVLVVRILALATLLIFFYGTLDPLLLLITSRPTISIKV